ncbi:MAG: hypothetical protein ABEJ25_01630 [Candidatus Bipolaricaulia bacterium]
MNDNAKLPLKEFWKNSIEKSMAKLIPGREGRFNTFDDNFEKFDILLSLCFLDQVVLTGADKILRAPIGSFTSNLRRSDPPGVGFVKQILAKGDGFELLHAGLFQGSIERLKDVLLRPAQEPKV